VPEKPSPSGRNRLTAAIAELPEEDVDSSSPPTGTADVPRADRAAQDTIERAPEQRDRVTRPRGDSAKRRESEAEHDVLTATVYMSEGLRTRLDKYTREKQWTIGEVVFDAVAQYYDFATRNHDRLAAIIKASTVSTGPINPLFPPDPRKVRYLGGGGRPKQFSGTQAQLAMLDEIGKALGFTNRGPRRGRSTWLAPVLNEYLPGRKERA
jgi:hypothetical protein